MANAPVRVGNGVACGVTSGRWPGEKDKRRDERSVVADSIPDPCGSVWFLPHVCLPQALGTCETQFQVTKSHFKSRLVIGA